MPIKTLNVPSFVAGVAAVLVILTLGFGGGVLMSNVLSDTSHKPNKLERLATGDAKEVKPVPAEVKLVTPAGASASAAATPVTPPAQAAVSATVTALDPAPVTPPAQQAAAEPQPAAQPTTQAAAPQPQPQQPQPQTTAQLGPQRPVALTQPTDDGGPSLSRRSERRALAQQRRDERARHREERRKQYAERRLQELSRREQIRSAVERSGPQDVDDDRDDDSPVMQPRAREFGPPRPFLRLFGGD